MSLLVEYIQEFGRFQRNARLYLISYALSGVTIGIFLVLYNLYLGSLGYGTDFIGVVLFALTIGVGIAIFPAGLCIDRLSGKTILIWSSVVVGLAGVGQILFRQPAPLLFSAFLAGLGSAFLYVINAPFLTANSTPRERPHLFSLTIVVTLGTTVLGEIIGGVLPLWLRSLPWLMAAFPPWIEWALAPQSLPRSYQLSLLLAGIIAAPSFIPLFFLSNDRPTKSPQVVREERERVALRQRLQQFIRRLRKPGSLREIIWSPAVTFVLVQTCIGLGAGLFIPYFNLYFVQGLGATSALFGIIDGGANALNALLTLVAPLLAARIGKVNTITFTRLISIPLLLTIGLVSYLPLAATLYLFRQGTMDMSAGLFQVFSMEEVSEERRGLANSSYQASYQIAWALTTPLGGLIIARLGYPPVFVAGAILYLVAIALLWLRFGRRQRSSSGQGLPGGLYDGSGLDRGDTLKGTR